MRLLNEYTHYGWFGICPVYLANLDTECPAVAPRRELYVPLFVISEWLLGAAIYVKTFLDPEWVPYWPIRVTGELT